MGIVICNKADTCQEKDFCGGAQPHYRDFNECGNCPMDKTAKCTPTDREITYK